MSYNIELKDPVTNIVAEVPGHLMIGGTYRADYHPNTGTFTPALNTEAQLNITYNYASYYKVGLPGKGIRTIYGMTGGESIVVLEALIEKIKEKYYVDNRWITSIRKETVYLNKNGERAEISDVLKDRENYKEEIVEVEIDEGETDSYWCATAANAMKPLYQLVALAKMRPDCIWDGD